jgi:hypothetical protein
MRASVVLSCVIAVAAASSVVYLGYRQSQLERRIDALARQLGATEDAVRDDARASAAGSVARAADDAPADSYAARLSAVEAQLPALRADVRSLEKATGDVAQTAVSDQQILAVMKQQGSKVIDAQLKFHRERWLESRESALNDFSSRYALTPTQNDELWELLSGEIDKMIELLRRPDLASDPERATREWREMLRETDDSALRLLEPLKATAWEQQRAAERKLLWPWLPD